MLPSKNFSFTSIDVFHDLLTRCGFSLGGRALSFYLIHKGIPAGIAFYDTIVLRTFFFTLVGTPFILQMNASGSSVEINSSASKDYWESFDLGVLEEAFSQTKSEGTGSVNQQEARPSHSYNPSASRGEGAGPANQPPGVVPYPYQPDEVIGGDSVLYIERRLLGKYSAPSYEDIRMARIEAEDLFEVKVEILKHMAALDPMGDWMGRGALALENPRTATGEESISKLYSILENLQSAGMESPVFKELQGKRLPRLDEDENSSS